MLQSLILLGPALAALLGPTAAQRAAAPPVALTAKRVHLGDGTVVENATVVVQGGKIVAVGTDVKPPAGAVVRTLDGELSPGLVALRDHSTARGEELDTTRNVLPTVDLALAFDAAHRDADALAAQGVTTAVLAAPGTELVGGLAAVVDPGSGAVLARRAMLCVGAGSRALSFDRYPTSTAAQFDELDRLFATTDGPEGAVFAAAKKRELPVLLDVTDRVDIQRASAFAKRHGLTGALIGAVLWGDVLGAVKDAGLSVVIGPFFVGGSPEAPRHAVRVAEAGIRFGFASDAPYNHPSLMRATAAQCVAAGMAPSAALRALTSDAAAIAGVGARTGKLAAGLEADLVLWSGPPTDLTSRPLLVWSDGALVHDAFAHGGHR